MSGAQSRWRGLTLQLFLMTILPLTALLLAITFGSLSLHQKAMRSMVGERDARLARAVADALDGQVQHRITVVRGLAQQVGSIDPQEILSASELLLTEFDQGLAFFAPDGGLEVTRADRSFWEEREEFVREMIQSLQSAPENIPHTTATLHTNTLGKPSVLVLAANPNGWVAAGAFSADALVSNALSAVFPDEHTSVAVVDAAGNPIYISGEFRDSATIGEHSGIAEALKGESGTVYVQTSEGEHVVAYSTVDTLGWALVVEEPWEMVSTPTLRTTQIAPLVLVPVLLLTLIALAFAVRQVVQPLQALEVKSSQLAWGDFDAIQKPVGGIEEIRRLQTALVHLAHKVRAAQQGLRGYIGAMTAAQEEERRRLARELHDDTLQSLIALKQRVQLAEMQIGNQASPESLAELSALTEQTIENLRRLTRALRPIYLEDLGLVTALEMLTREIGQTMDLQIQFQKIGVERRLQPDIELAFYRIAQEALSNIARHAQASAASLEFRFSPDEVVLEVSDNGRGFEVPKSPAEFAPGGHFGLLGLYERAELISATLRIASTPGEGTRLTVSLPSS